MPELDEAVLDDIALRASEYQPVTREEAIALTRRVRKLCKGPFKSEKHKAEYQELRAAAGGPALSADAQARGYSIELLDSLNREGCGADFNDVLVQYPFDGQEHEAPCPKCGMIISFRSPIFVLSD